MEFSVGPSFERAECRHSRGTPACMTLANTWYNYTWNCSIRDYHQRVAQSTIFSIGPNSLLEWSMMLYPKGFDSLDSKTSLFLRCDNFSASDVKAKFYFRLIHPMYAPDPCPVMRHYCVFKKGRQSTSFGYRKFVGYLGRDFDFKIYCQIKVCPNDGDSKDQEPFKVPRGRLLNDMASVFASGEFTDFVINSDGVSFPVHKAILAARSTVFASMFEHNMKERIENHVEIPDTTPGAIKEMLRFIYTDEVTEIEEVADELLAVAEKYALDRLKAMCEEALRGMIKLSNAAEILIHADLHRADQLKSRAIDFINCNTKDVMETSGFKSMVTSHPHLMAEILRASVTKRKRDEDS